MRRCCDSLKSLPLVQPDAISYEHSGYTVRLIHKELKPSVEVTKEPGVLPRTMWMSHLGSDLQAPVKTAGQKRLHPGLCPGPNIPLQGRQGSRGCIPDSPEESGLVYTLESLQGRRDLT